MSAPRAIAIVSALCIAIRLVSLAFVTVPGYTDAYYYADVAEHLVDGQGLVADFVWSPLEARGFPALPVPSHRFWMPLASVVQAAGMTLFGPLGRFHAAQLAVLFFAALIPLRTDLAGRSIGASERWALLGAVIAGLGGLFAPAFVTLDSYGVAAILGTVFFLSFARAAGRAADVRAGAVAGLAVGVLFLARAEAALFGLALVALAFDPRTRRAGVVGGAVAMAIGLAWLVRDVTLAPAADVFARSVLLVHYEDLFASRDPTLGEFVAAAPTVLVAKANALGTNALTFLFAFAILPVFGLTAGARALWSRAEVRAYVWLAVLVFLAQSLVWTLHSTRGSYVHSLAALLPFGFALAAAGGETLARGRALGPRVLAVSVSLAAVVAISVAALLQFDPTYGANERARRAALDAIPSGPFLAIDAAAWRWIADRPVIVTPADGLAAAACAAMRYGARSIVLEEAHFSAYDDLYRGGARPSWLAAPIDRGGIRVYPVIGTIDTTCLSIRAGADTRGRLSLA